MERLKFNPMEGAQETAMLAKSMEDKAEGNSTPNERILGKVVGTVAEAYFAPKVWEKEGRIYRWLGVRTFKKYIPSSDKVIRFVRRRGGSHLNWFSMPEPTLAAAKKYERFTRIWETVHAAGLTAATIGLYSSLSDGSIDSGTFINTATGLINLYPVMLQRYNRARIYGLLKRAEKLEEERQTKNQNP